MKKTHLKKTSAISLKLIAPCGMNCRLCWGYIREKNACPGCLGIDSQESQKSKCRVTCKIKNCEQLAKSKTKHCSNGCDRFPCARLKQMDKRYRTKYGMSIIDNLKMIHEAGIRNFIMNEKLKWSCPGCSEVICVHKPACIFCGHKWY